MKRQNRHILLFIDNCTAHNNIPALSNINVEFLPANTTSKLQPLDQGIIQNFKTFYRREVVDYILAVIEKDTDPNINVLQAMRMACAAWSSVTQGTIANCFRKSGFRLQDSEESVFSSDEIVEPQNWQELHRAMPGVTLPSFEEFVRVDDNTYTCGSPTEEEIVAEVTQPLTEELSEDDDDDEDHDTNTPAHISCRDALTAVQTLTQFLELKDNVLDSFFSNLIDLQKFVKNSVHYEQKTIDNYFTNM